jgi:23S rRNA (guanosine2251-2'-O)-methyltransferase
MNHETELIFGIHPVLEKLKACPNDVTQVIIANGSSGGATKAVDATARKFGLEVSYASSNVLDRLTRGQRHQGVVAKIRAFTYLDIPELRAAVSSSASETVLLLDGLTDPGNFGALLRTAEAAGIQHVVIPKDRSVDVTPTVVKASAGAAHHLKIYKVTNLRRVVEMLKACGFWIAGLDVHATAAIYDQVMPERLAIILGSEGEGIRPLIRRECDFLLSIPMTGKITSLNVAAAGAVFLYEIFRQKRSVDKGGSKGY